MMRTKKTETSTTKKSETPFEYVFGSKTVPLLVRVGRLSIPAGLYERWVPQRLKNYLTKRERRKRESQRAAGGHREDHP